MIALNLTAVETEQEIIKGFLEGQVSNTLAYKINNGVVIEKDGKKLINKKTLESFMKYACDEARKQAEKGATSACIGQDIVFNWAIHYFEEDNIEGKLYNEDGTEYKLPKPVIQNKPATTVTNNVIAPKPKPQMSLFDLLDTPATATKVEPKASIESMLCENDNEDADNSEVFNSDDLQNENLEESADETDDNNNLICPPDLYQISKNQWTNNDGVVYEVKEIKKENIPDALTKLFGNAIIAR